MRHRIKDGDKRWLQRETFLNELIYCEAPATADDVLYSDSDDEASENSSARRARIEARAQEFLKGAPIFILSASLKGPFTKKEEWQNPWRRKSRKWKDAKVCPQQDFMGASSGARHELVNEKSHEDDGVDIGILSATGHSVAATTLPDLNSVGLRRQASEWTRKPLPASGCNEDSTRNDVNQYLASQKIEHITRWNESVAANRGVHEIDQDFWCPGRDFESDSTSRKRSAGPDWLQTKNLKRLRSEPASSLTDQLSSPVSPRHGQRVDNSSCLVEFDSPAEQLRANSQISEVVDKPGTASLVNLGTNKSAICRQSSDPASKNLLRLSGLSTPELSSDGIFPGVVSQQESFLMPTKKGSKAKRSASRTTERGGIYTSKDEKQTLLSDSSSFSRPTVSFSLSFQDTEGGLRGNSGIISRHNELSSKYLSRQNDDFSATANRSSSTSLEGLGMTGSRDSASRQSSPSAAVKHKPDTHFQTFADSSFHFRSKALRDTTNTVARNLIVKRIKPKQMSNSQQGSSTRPQSGTGKGPRPHTTRQSTQKQQADQGVGPDVSVQASSNVRENRNFRQSAFVKDIHLPSPVAREGSVTASALSPSARSETRSTREGSTLASLRVPQDPLPSHFSEVTEEPIASTPPRLSASKGKTCPPDIPGTKTLLEEAYSSSNNPNRFQNPPRSGPGTVHQLHDADSAIKCSSTQKTLTSTTPTQEGKFQRQPAVFTPCRGGGSATHSSPPGITPHNHTTPQPIQDRPSGQQARGIAGNVESPSHLIQSSLTNRSSPKASQQSLLVRQTNGLSSSVVRSSTSKASPSKATSDAGHLGKGLASKEILSVPSPPQLGSHGLTSSQSSLSLHKLHKAKGLGGPAADVNERSLSIATPPADPGIQHVQSFVSLASTQTESSPTAQSPWGTAATSTYVVSASQRPTAELWSSQWTTASPSGSLMETQTSSPVFGRVIAPSQQSPWTRITANEDVVTEEQSRSYRLSSQSSGAEQSQSPWQEGELQELKGTAVLHRGFKESNRPNTPSRKKNDLGTLRANPQNAPTSEMKMPRKQPLTPTRPSDSLVADFTMEMPSFSPLLKKQSRKTPRSSLKIGCVPSLPCLNDSLSNPWLQASKAKVKKRVSWAPLPEGYRGGREGDGDEKDENQNDTSGVSLSTVEFEGSFKSVQGGTTPAGSKDPLPRPRSPPPVFTESDLLTEEGSDTAKKFGKHFNAVTECLSPRPCPRQEKLCLLPSESQLNCASPSVEAMAEAFIDADEHTKSAAGNEQDEITALPAETANATSEAETSWQIICGLTDGEKSALVDAVLDDIDNMLGTYDVDAEVKKVERKQKSGGTRYEDSPLGPRSLKGSAFNVLGDYNVWNE